MKFIKTYFSDVKRELKKVTWLTKDAMIGSTAVVWIFAIVTGLFLWIVDLGMTSVVTSLFSFGQWIK